MDNHWRLRFWTTFMAAWMRSSSVLSSWLRLLFFEFLSWHFCTSTSNSLFLLLQEFNTFRQAWALSRQSFVPCRYVAHESSCSLQGDLMAREVLRSIRELTSQSQREMSQAEQMTRERRARARKGVALVMANIYNPRDRKEHSESLLALQTVSADLIISMFATIMESLLVKHLGKYLDGIKNNMDISLISGNITIDNISLRPEFINELGLPFTLKFSHVSRILINVPWTSLKEKPTTVSVQGVYVLLSLKYDQMDDNYIDVVKRVKQIGSRVKAQLKKKLQNKQSGTNKEETFAEKSLIRIIDNLVLNIDQIHVRIESIKRNWDFSLGLLLDKISCHTVNDFGQKQFYTRHFTHKELNAPLKKSFNVGRCELYFNDAEEFFLSWQVQQGKEKMIRLLAEPFGGPILTKSSSKLSKSMSISSSGSVNSANSTGEVGHSYNMKTMSKFEVDVVIEQKLSAQGKFVVDVNVQLPKVEMQMSDRQFSQVMIVLELFYEWWLDMEKNGRRTNTFDEKIQQYFKALILKIAKEQRLSDIELKDLQKIVSENTLNQLENAADSLIRECRIEKEMKKINKISNKDKSKQMVEKLLQKLDNENQDIMELFQHITINANVPEFRLSCLSGEHTLLSFGLISINSQVKLVLGKSTLATVHVSEPFLQERYPTERSLIVMEDKQYMKQPFIELSLSQTRSMPAILKASIKKRHICIRQENLQSLVSWFACIRLKPPLVNFIDEQLNYSIHITQEIFYMLFSHKEASINLHVQAPIITIELSDCLPLTINPGTIQVKRESHDEYRIQVVEEQWLRMGEDEVGHCKEGNSLSLVNQEPQTVQILVCNMKLSNVDRILKFASQAITNPLIPMVMSMSCMQSEQVVFEGDFYLNEFVHPQKMVMEGNHLKFLPSGVDIYLLRTKMYPLLRKGRFGLIFRQQVEKTINIVTMESEKLMQTLFLRLKEHMLYICTLAQWKKYYHSFSDKLITELHEVQYAQDNNKLIDLNILVQNCSIDIAGQPEPVKMAIQKMRGSISYKEYNTDASGEVGSFSVVIGKERLIENLNIKGTYSYIDFMTLQISVSLLKLNLLEYDTIEQIVAILSSYAVRINPIVKDIKQLQGPHEVRPKQEEFTRNSAEDKKYLLESRISLDFRNLEANIIGYKNSIRQASLELLKHRDNPRPDVSLTATSAVLMTLMTAKRLQVSLDGSQLKTSVSGLGLNLSTELLLYQLTSGKGNIFLNSILNLLETHREIKEQNLKHHSGEKENLHCTFEVDGLRMRLKLAEEEEIILKAETCNIAMDIHASDKHSVIMRLGWRNICVVLWQHSILQPLTGELQLNDAKQCLMVKVKSEPILINVPIHSLAQSVTMLVAISKQIMAVPLIKTLLNYESLEHIDKKLAPQLVVPPCIELESGSVRVKVLNNKKEPLMRARADFSKFSTGADSSTVEFTVEHMNPTIKIFEPILEKSEIQLQLKRGPQLVVETKSIRINISEALIQSAMREGVEIARLIKDNSKGYSLRDIEGSEVEKIKSIINSIIQSDYIDEEQVEDERMGQNEADREGKVEMYLHNTKSIVVSNWLHSQALVELKIDEEKNVLHLNENRGTVYFKAKSKYKESYQIIEKYKRVLVKLSIPNKYFAAEALYFLIFLHSRSFFYQPITFLDEDGDEIKSAVGLALTEDIEGDGSYALKIVSPYKVVNQTNRSIGVKWVYQDHNGGKQLEKDEQVWVAPWINSKISISFNEQDNIYSSPYQYPLNSKQPYTTYEVNLNKTMDEPVYNLCLLMITKTPFPLHRTVEDNLPCIPGAICVKPAIFIVNHFHFPVSINDTVCHYGEKTALYHMFRAEQKEFLKVRLGDGSMHEVYVPSAGNYNEVELKIKNDNFVVLSIFHMKGHPGQQIAIYHLYCKLELIVTLPRMQDLSLSTIIYGNRYRLKKQVELSDTFECERPSPSGCHDKFLYSSSVSILGEHEKYLNIRVSQADGQIGKDEITLYPSYYGDQITLKPMKMRKGSMASQYQDDSPSKDAPVSQISAKKFSINYNFVKIHEDIVMYYVSVVPRCYVLNLSSSHLNVDGQGSLRHRERVIVSSEKVEISCMDSEYHWQLLNNNLAVDLEKQREIIMFKEVEFREHEIAAEMKAVMNGGSGSQLMPPNKQIIINSDHLNILRVMRHRGSFNTTTYCLQDWQEWISIHNHLKVPVTVISPFVLPEFAVDIKTVINPGHSGRHPYGLEQMKNISFYCPFKCKDTLLGEYDINMRINDLIELDQQGGQKKEEQDNQDSSSEIISLVESKVKKGRKILILPDEGTDSQNQRHFMSAGSLKISQSISIRVKNIGVSLIGGEQKHRRELLKAHLRDSNITILLYPSGLYMLNVESRMRVHASQMIPPVLEIPHCQFYIEGVQKKFIERVCVKADKQMSVFLTDKLISEMINFGTTIAGEFNQLVRDHNEEPLGIDEVDQFYTSSLNSITVSAIPFKLTLKRLLVEDSESHKLLRDMGLSIVELEQSSIKLSAVSIEEPVNTKHLNEVTKMYVMEIIVGCLGGLNLIGNPKQFVEEIEAGKLKGKPVMGFLGGVLAGTANSMSKILSTVSNGISSLSMDHEYQRHRNESYMVHPKGLFNGLKEGTKTFAYSVKSGVIGLVERPYQGSKQGGIGFLKGSLEGMAGLIIKPVTGLMDAASMTVHGLKSTTSYKENDEAEDYSCMDKPLYHKFRVIRPFDSADEVIFNCLLRVSQCDDKIAQAMPIAFVEAFHLEDEDGAICEEAVLITCDSLYLLNIQSDKLELEIKNDKMIATGKFLEGVVLYYEDGTGEQEEIVFRIQSNPIKKERLFWTIKAFISLYAQSKDSEQIPQ